MPAKPSAIRRPKNFKPGPTATNTKKPNHSLLPPRSFRLQLSGNMFAVPGWTVSAPIKAQVETPKPKDPNKLGKKALKRKEKQEVKVNTENIGEFWDKAVEAVGLKPTEAPKGGKNAQDEAKSETNGAPVIEVEATGAGATEKRGKKRKRGKAGGRKNREDGGEVAEKAETAESVTKTLKHTTKDTQASSADKPVTTDGESKRDKKKRKKEHSDDSKSPVVEPTLPAAVDLLPEPKGLTPLQKSMRSKLASARFRHLNESLYTKPSAESLDLFKQDPSMFEDYHRGFQQQVEVWPSNPVDSYVSSILARGKISLRDPWKAAKRLAKKGKAAPPEEEAPTSAVVRATGDAKPLPRNLKGHCTIADLGCGTASLSYRLQPHLKALNLTFHSFDLAKPTGPSAHLVTVADISALPLADNSMDIAIFCLALMGTNWLDFIDEAYRILRWKGELWISEIKSRFGRADPKTTSKIPINSIGSLHKKDAKPKKKKNAANTPSQPEPEGPQTPADESLLATAIDGAPPTPQDATHIAPFLAVLRARGFVLDAPAERPLEAVDSSNKMFVQMRFVKAAHPSGGRNARADQRVGSGKMGRGEKGGDVGEEGEVEGKAGEVLKPCLYKIR
ncbi:hypothetical protein LEMA_P058080.1 [Plenodomus lingam JN3]|uniref:Ribosomal RNA-processing protein 8 n=1 Tax=Leptosphaeria maculans (strain JN3 / isolate v23.1.3 / race Av1-4-5-6-7-8) TaxID=985895 RepID=E4ZIB3_LEPMJ|nr:hypothetical protein LEMA_P058080.1 [Plenodomus lingam JN3]CBX90774.1 hypothetical protein LEMA_P058080.1 [Plenodomus lingam JN3]